MRKLVKYVIEYKPTKKYLIAIGEEEHAPLSGAWDKDIEKAKVYDQESAERVANLLNRIYKDNMELDTKVIALVKDDRK
jgi:hypothetical protein